jgi:putrescine aminotransferase
MSKVRTTEEWKALDAKSHLHPFTDFNEHAKTRGRIIERAEHIYIYDTDGNKFLDGMSGLWCCSLGYSQPKIADAVQRQFQQLPYYNNFFQCSNAPAVELADRLVSMAPEQFSHVFFTNSGSEANDTNIRLVRRYWDLQNKPNKRIILSRNNAYHGSTIASASLGGFEFVHNQFEKLPYIEHIVDPNWYKNGGDLSPEEFGIQAARALEKKIDELGEDNIAAFIAEPLQGAGGVIVPPDSYWPEVSRILKARNILFISDEVICGFGRTGQLFGCQTYATEPDLITFAKAVTNGFQPLGGVLVLARSALVEPRLDISLAQFDPRRAAVHRRAKRGPVAFAPGRDAEKMAEGIERHDRAPLPCGLAKQSPVLKNSPQHEYCRSAEPELGQRLPRAENGPKGVHQKSLCEATICSSKSGKGPLTSTSRRPAAKTW